MSEREKTDQRRLRICFVGTPWLAVGPDRGGIEKVLLELSRIISRDHEVHVVCPTPRDEAPSTGEPKIVFHYAPVTEVRRYPIRDKLDFTLEGILLSVRFLCVRRDLRLQQVRCGAHLVVDPQPESRCLHLR